MKKGFTYLELVVVLLILSFFFVLIQKGTDLIRNATLGRDVVAINNLRQAINNYFEENDRTFPANFTQQILIDGDYINANALRLTSAKRPLNLTLVIVNNTFYSPTTHQGDDVAAVLDSADRTLGCLFDAIADDSNPTSGSIRSYNEKADDLHIKTGNCSKITKPKQYAILL